jgi:hypothetical protein
MLKNFGYVALDIGLDTNDKENILYPRKNDVLMDRSNRITE